MVRITDEWQKSLTSALNIPTIVEGKNDRRALEQLGFSNIIELDRPLFEIIELFEKGSTVQILTDFDAAGKSLYKQLHRGLSSRGVHIDNTLRHELLKTSLSHVEGLVTFLQNN